MKCPKCGYTSFDYLNNCSKCGQSLEECRKTLNLLFGKPTLFTAAEPPPEAALIKAATPEADSQVPEEQQPPAAAAAGSQNIPSAAPADGDESRGRQEPPAAILGTMDLLSAADNDEVRGEDQLESLTADRETSARKIVVPTAGSEDAATDILEDDSDFLDMNVEFNADLGTEDLGADDFAPKPAAAAEDKAGKEEKVIELQEDQAFDLELELDSETAALEVELVKDKTERQ